MCLSTCDRRRDRYNPNNTVKFGDARYPSPPRGLPKTVIREPHLRSTPRPPKLLSKPPQLLTSSKHLIQSPLKFGPYQNLNRHALFRDSVHPLSLLLLPWIFYLFISPLWIFIGWIYPCLSVGFLLSQLLHVRYYCWTWGIGGPVSYHYFASDTKLLLN